MENTKSDKQRILFLERKIKHLKKEMDLVKKEIEITKAIREVALEDFLYNNPGTSD